MEQGQANIGNLLGMARTAVEARNDDEAISYLNRVLEIDPTISEAWMEKGRAVARQSSLQNVRMHETAVAFGHAIGTAPDPERAITAELAAKELTICGMKTLTQLHDHVAQFAGVAGLAERRVSVSLAIMDAMDVGMRWMPNFATGLRLVVRAGTEALSAGLTPNLEADVCNRVSVAKEKLRAVDPAFATEEELAENAARAEAERRADEEPIEKKAERFAMYAVIAVVVVAVIMTIATR